MTSGKQFGMTTLISLASANVHIQSPWVDVPKRYALEWRDKKSIKGMVKEKDFFLDLAIEGFALHVHQQLISHFYF